MKILKDNSTILSITAAELKTIIYETAVTAFRLYSGDTISRSVFLRMIDGKRTVLDDFVRRGIIHPITNSEYKKAKWQISINEALTAVELYDREKKREDREAV